MASELEREKTQQIVADKESHISTLTTQMQAATTLVNTLKTQRTQLTLSLEQERQTFQQSNAALSKQKDEMESHMVSQRGRIQDLVLALREQEQLAQRQAKALSVARAAAAPEPADIAALDRRIANQELAYERARLLHDLQTIQDYRDQSRLDAEALSQEKEDLIHTMQSISETLKKKIKPGES